LIAIVADRFRKSQLRSVSSFDENEDEEIRQKFQKNLANETAPVPQAATNTFIRTLPLTS
jgi:hypothetical protein